MRVADTTRKNPVTIPGDSTLADAARLMDETASGSVVVLDGGRPVGIATDRDIVVRGVARSVPMSARIDSVMSTPLVAIDSDADLREAIRIFSDHGFRRLPVVDGGSMVGMVTVDDLVVDVVGDLSDLIRPVTAQVIFGHPEPGLPKLR